MRHGSYIIKLPFSGFYGSRIGGELDYTEEQEVERYAERQAEDGVPKELRLDEGEIAELFMQHSAYSTGFEHVAKAYADAFRWCLKDRLDFDPRFAFEKMTSPQYYNFETDRLFAYVPRSTLRRLFALSKADKHETLRRIVTERCTSRDGFISWYSNDLGEWLRKPVTDWDHNELELLLLAVIELTGNSERFEYEVEDMLYESSTFYEAVSEQVDWPALDAAAQELRDEKLAAIKAIDPEFELPPPRCDKTLDLFLPQG
jgi:hypothetical protein